MILDEQMPTWHFRERHAIRVGRPLPQVLAAARAVTPREVPAFRVLMGLRSLPASAARRSRRRDDAPLLDGFIRMGFAALGESELELTYGGVGRFWQLAGGLRPVAAAEFAGFHEPGYAKAGFNFVAEPDGLGGCLLATETRVLATDERARRRFARYWLLIRPGSGLIRRAWLRAIKARAER